MQICKGTMATGINKGSCFVQKWYCFCSSVGRWGKGLKLIREWFGPGGQLCEDNGKVERGSCFQRLIKYLTCALFQLKVFCGSMVVYWTQKNEASYGLSDKCGLHAAHHLRQGNDVLGHFPNAFFDSLVFTTWKRKREVLRFYSDYIPCTVHGNWAIIWIIKLSLNVWTWQETWKEIPFYLWMAYFYR